MGFIHPPPPLVKCFICSPLFLSFFVISVFLHLFGFVVFGDSWYVSVDVLPYADICMCLPSTYKNLGNSIVISKIWRGWSTNKHLLWYQPWPQCMKWLPYEYRWSLLSKPQPNLNTRLGLTIKWLCKPPTHPTPHKLNISNISVVTDPILMKLWR